MVHGTARFWDGKAWGWDTIATELPLPTARLGEAVGPASQASTNGYVAVAGTRLDTLLQAAGSLGYQVGAATAGVTFKVVGSFDGVAWHDVLGFDDTGTVYGAADVPVASAASAAILLPANSSVLGMGCYRYYQVVEKSTVADTPGTGTVTGFCK